MDLKNILPSANIRDRGQSEARPTMRQYLFPTPGEVLDADAQRRIDEYNLRQQGLRRSLQPPGIPDWRTSPPDDPFLPQVSRYRDPVTGRIIIVDSSEFD